MSLQITATIKAVLPQLVHCVHCDCKFIYEQTVTGSAMTETGLFYSEETARTDADRGARVDLANKLNNPELCKPTPCRSCFKYQPYMCRKLAAGRFKEWGCVCWFFMTGGVFAAVIGALVWFNEVQQRGIAAWVFGGGMVVALVSLLVLITTRRLSAGYDPNAEPLTKRRKLADEKARTLEEFDGLQQSRVRDAYRAYTTTVLHGGGRGGNPYAPVEPLVVDWWALPSIFLEGGSITIRLSDTQQVTVVVPENANPGDVFDLRSYPADVKSFRVCVLAIRVHPDEHRLE